MRPGNVLEEDGGKVVDGDEQRAAQAWAERGNRLIFGVDPAQRRAPLGLEGREGAHSWIFQRSGAFWRRPPPAGGRRFPRSGLRVSGSS